MSFFDGLFSGFLVAMNGARDRPKSIVPTPSSLFSDNNWLPPGQQQQLSRTRSAELQANSESSTTMSSATATTMASTPSLSKKPSLTSLSRLKSLKRKRSNTVSLASSSASTNEREHSVPRKKEKRESTVVPESLPSESLQYDLRDVHGALRVNGSRLVVETINFDVLAIDRPDDVVLKLDDIIHQIQIDNDVLYYLWASVFRARQTAPTNLSSVPLAQLACNIFFVNLGEAILDIIPGKLHVPIDPRLSSSVADIVQQTSILLSLFFERNVPGHRLVFDIPATHAGIAASRILSKQFSVHVNLLFVSDLVQAAACFSAEPFSITVSVGQMLHGAESRSKSLSNPFTSNSIGDHPAYESIRAMHAYLEMHNLDCILMVDDIATPEVLSPLSFASCLCLHTNLIHRLRWFAIMHQNTSLFLPPTASPKAEARARTVPYPASALQTNEAPTLDLDAITYPTIRKQSKYVTKEWIMSTIPGYMHAIPSTAAKKTLVASIEVRLERMCVEMSVLEQMFQCQIEAQEDIYRGHSELESAGGGYDSTSTLSAQ